MPFTLERESDPLYKDGIEKGLKRGIERGREEGQKRGVQKGSFETKIAIAKALLKQGIDIEVIVKSTGLSKKEIKKIQ